VLCDVRQFDLISPDLFVLSIERLFLLIDCIVVEQNLWSPVQLSMGTKNNLEFADAIYLFVEAYWVQMEGIQTILEFSCIGLVPEVSQDNNLIFFSMKDI
jgi:hypothetical protein